MPIIQTPALRVVNRNEKGSNYVIVASFNFAPDTPVAVRTIPGMVIAGVEYLIDFKSIGQNLALPDFKTMCFSAQFFSPATAGEADGALIFYDVATSSMQRFGQMTTASGVDCFDNLTAVIPMVTEPSTVLHVIKEAGGAGIANTMGGNLYLSLFSFAMQPYTVHGYSNLHAQQ